MCTTYQFNDAKLFKIIDDFIIKQELNQKLQRVSDRLRVWHEQFFEEKSKKENRVHRNSHDEVLLPIAEKDSFEEDMRMRSNSPSEFNLGSDANTNKHLYAGSSRFMKSDSLKGSPFFNFLLI